MLAKYIPNTITCLNLFSGCVAAVLAFEGNFVGAAFFVYLSAFFDFLDGFFARALKAYSLIGKELDSLADLISFGFVPSVVVFTILGQWTQTIGYPYLPYLGFLMTVFSALRLAIFNIDERQTTTFIGMPTPANALFWVSLGVWWVNGGNEYFSPICIIVLVVLFSYLLVSSLKMFSFKISRFSFKGLFLPVSLILVSLISIFAFGFIGISVSIFWYILASIGYTVFNRKFLE